MIVRVRVRNAGKEAAQGEAEFGVGAGGGEGGRQAFGADFGRTDPGEQHLQRAMHLEGRNDPAENAG